MLTNDEVACVYSALILQDDDIAVTAEKINTILKAAGVEVEPYWPTLFAKALEGIDLKQLITNVSAGVGAGGGGVVAGGAPIAGSEAPSAKEEPKKEEKKEESEESDEDMGFGLFD